MVFSPIGLVWSSCLNFTVSFATEVEKTDHRVDVLIEVSAPQKTQREQPDTFYLQQIT